MDIVAAAEYNPNKPQPRPYVRFEFRATEDRTAPSSDGVTQLRDVAFAIVRAPGAKDSLEKNAEDWLRQLETYAKDDRVPREWPRQYRDAFEQWKKGEEMPLSGTPIKSWPPLTPSQRQNVINAEIYTVEDLAAANDEIRGRIGMGAHGVQAIAVRWLEEAKGAGSTAKELAATKLQLEELMTTVREQATALAALQPKAAAKLTT